MERKILMEKITKKELLEKLGFSDLSDEALEKVFGGEGEGDIDSGSCVSECIAMFHKPQELCEKLCGL